MLSTTATIMAKRISINIDTLSYYVEQSSITPALLQESIPDYDQFIVGNKLPTYSQLEKISKLIKIPVGLLSLEKPVDVNTQRLSFRTHRSQEIMNMSPELRDTIIEMQEKQAFLQNQIGESLNFANGQIARTTNYLIIAEYVRDKLSIPINHLPESKSAPIRYFRDKISSAGVFIFFNGKIRDNPHRPLNPNEFRGFSLNSPNAPIIFINQKDSQNAQLFTLIHELVHLFIDNEGISSKDEQSDYSHTEVEALVNRVAAEILVPRLLFERENTLNVEELANKYRVSRYVITRRLLDLGKINQNQYDDIINSIEIDTSPRRRPTGGNYGNNLKFRVDKTFFRFVHNALMQDRVSYTEAFRLIGTGYKGFKTLEKDLI